MRSVARRGVLGAIALAGLLAARAARAAERGRLLVAGPPQGWLDGIAGSLRPALLAGLGTGAAIDQHAVGGDDGVTGANQFQAWFAGEEGGTPLLLMPGTVASAWLEGDQRASYDLASWLPLLCGLGSGVFVVRHGSGAPKGDPKLRVAVSDPAGAAAPCLLGLDLLGVSTSQHVQENRLNALRAGLVDAAFLREVADVAAAKVAGAVPMFTLGAPETQGGRDPAWPDVPSIGELVVRRGLAPDLPLVRALGAAAAASMLDFCLLLPALTHADRIAMWRRAVDRAARAPALAETAPARILGEPACGTVFSSIAVEAPVLLAYRGWLSVRLGIRPG